MNRILLLFTFTFLNLVGISQDFTNKGKDFWILFPPHQPAQGSLANLSIYISSDKSSTGKIYYGDGDSLSFSVQPNTPLEYILNRSKTYVTGAESALDIDSISRSKIVSNKSIHIKVDQDKPPVVAYAHMYAGARSAATIILPTAVLERKYIALTYFQTPNGISSGEQAKSQFSIIATEAKTKVRIRLRKNGIFNTNSYEIIFNKQGDIYTIQDDQDLTGSEIESIADKDYTCKKIAVFSGSSSLKIPYIGNAQSIDPLFQQCYPINTWGKNYFVTPFKGKIKLIFRVLSGEDETIVKINDREIKLNKGSFYEGNENSDALPCFISSNKGIQVAQYSYTQNQDAGVGDPEMIILNSIEQNINDITVFLSSKNSIVDNNINVVIKNSGINSFTINGKKPNSAFIPIPSSDYSYLIENLQVNPNDFLGIRMYSDSGFNAFCYGFGNFESYGYSAGTSVKNLEQYVSTKNKYSKIDFPATCINTPFNFFITLPYKPTSLQWGFLGNKDLGNDPDLVTAKNGLSINPDDSIVNPTNIDKYLYIYKLKNKDNSLIEYTISKAGSYPILVTTNNPSKDGCSGEQIIQFDLNVYDPPVSKFTIVNSGCVDDSLILISNSNTENIPIINFLWSIDEKVNDTLTKIYKIKFDTDGLKKIGLAVITNVGCVSNNYDTTILLSKKPSPQFEPAGSLCIGKEQILIDKSLPQGNSTIEEWIWSYSDSQKPDTFNVSSVTKSPPKIFNDSIVVVKLDLKTNSGCKNSFTDTLKIRPNPIVQMILPEICLEDSIAIFKSVSTVSGSENKIDLFEWNFGDSASSKEFNKGIGEISKHRYTYPGNYKISLSTTTNFGCNSMADSSFTINGSTPRAEFKVISESGLCSNKPITIKNTSAVDVGSVGKIELFWDFDGVSNRPDSTDENPKVNGLYAKKFDNFQFTSRTIRIYMTAYTGGVCKDSYDSTIVLNGSPLDSLRDLSPICTRKDKRLLDAAVIQKVSGVNGVEVYSGKGVVSEGGKYYFDPKIDSGYYTIYHKYTTEKGCYAEDSTVIRVNFTPVIDAGPDMTVLDDTTRQILAKATGVDMKYVWTPKLYLSSDTILQPIVIKPVTDITYKLAVTGSGNCTEIDQFKMTALNMIEPTNTFTPNGDGINDTWSIKYIEKYPESVVEVFNIQGNRVYKSPSKYIPWDGKTKEGNVLPAGTYYYFIDPRNFRKQRTGFVTILK